MHFLRFFSTWLPVCFLSSFPVSLPQLFHRCSPFSVLRLPLGVFLALAFISSGSRLGFNYSAFCFFFSLLPVFPSQRFLRCASVFINLPTLAYLFSLDPVTGSSFQLWYSAFPAIPFPVYCFASQVLLQFPASCFQLGRSPWLAL